MNPYLLQIPPGDLFVVLATTLIIVVVTLSIQQITDNRLTSLAPALCTPGLTIRNVGAQLLQSDISHESNACFQCSLINIECWSMEGGADSFFLITDAQEVKTRRRTSSGIILKARSIKKQEQKCSYHPGLHKFDADMQDEAFRWFDRWLKA